MKKKISSIEDQRSRFCRHFIIIIKRVISVAYVFSFHRRSSNYSQKIYFYFYFSFYFRFCSNRKKTRLQYFLTRQKRKNSNRFKKLKLMTLRKCVDDVFTMTRTLFIKFFMIITNFRKRFKKITLMSSLSNFERRGVSKRTRIHMTISMILI